jgi:hypothetical protein
MRKKASGPKEDPTLRQRFVFARGPHLETHNNHGLEMATTPGLVHCSRPSAMEGRNRDHRNGQNTENQKGIRDKNGKNIKVDCSNVNPHKHECRDGSLMNCMARTRFTGRELSSIVKDRHLPGDIHGLWMLELRSSQALGATHLQERRDYHPQDLES